MPFKLNPITGKLDLVNAASSGGSYTDEEAQDAVGTILTDSATIDFTYDDATPSITAILIDDSVTNTKLANMATQTIKGRTTAGTGDPEDLSASQVLTILGAVVGPSSATDNAIARFDGTTGKLIQNSGVIIDDTNEVSGVLTMTIGVGGPTDLLIQEAGMDFNQAFTFSGTNDIDFVNSAGDFTVNAGTSCQFNTVQPLSFVNFVTGGTDFRLDYDDAITFNATTSNTFNAGTYTNILTGPFIVGGTLNSFSVAASTNNYKSIVEREVTTGADNFFSVAAASTTATLPARFDFIKTESATFATPGGLSSTNVIGHIRALGYDGTSTYREGASILFGANAAWSNTSTSGYIDFYTTPTNTTPSRRFRITTGGNLAFGPTLQHQFGSDGTNVILNPKVSGSGILVIGSSSASADADVLLNRLALGNTAISPNAYINAAVTDSGRGILSFTLTYNGTGAIAALCAVTLNCQGTVSTSFTATGYSASVQLQTTTHTTYTQQGLIASMGIQNTQTLSSGTYTLYGVRAQMSANGRANASSSGYTFRRYGLFIDSITAGGGTPTTDLIMGIYSSHDVNVPEGIKYILDSTSTALGDSYFVYDTANTEVDVFVDGTNAFTFDTAINRSEVILGTKAGTSGTFAKVGGTVDVNSTAVGNVGAGEDDLMSFSIPANSMAVNGDHVVIRAGGTFAANANTKRLRVKYGATTILDTTAVAFNNAPWWIECMIIRTGATTQKCHAYISVGGAVLLSSNFYATAAETLSGGVTFKLTGEATSNDDIIQEWQTIQYRPTE